MSLLQFYIDQLELISLLVKVPKLSIFLFFKRIILCFSACFQEFAAIFIDTFSSCMSSCKKISCFCLRLFRECLQVLFLISEFKEINYFILALKSYESL